MKKLFTIFVLLAAVTRSLAGCPGLVDFENFSNSVISNNTVHDGPATGLVSGDHAYYFGLFDSNTTTTNVVHLDDGTPTLILDADDLVRSMDKLLGQGTLQKVTAAAESARPRARRRVLVVDDSITVREVERRLLENNGYEVAVAVDGMDGWNALQRASFDLLVTDVDMPRMDGLELVRHVRAAPRTASLPIVIVSYKEQPEYRLKGMEAGANYYLTKSSFHDESLVGAVRDLIGEA